MQYVVKLKESLKDEFINLFSNFNKEKKGNNFFFRDKNITITLFSTNKVLIQGTEALVWYEKICKTFSIKKEELSNTNLHSLQGTKRVGIDESGKGDFFGPLIIASYLIQDSFHEQKLQTLGVKDSKKISDQKTIQLAKQIMKMGAYNIVVINPPKYNELYKKIPNVNQILAWGHAKTLENMLEKYSFDLAISDQFASKDVLLNKLQEQGKKIQLWQEHKAEHDIAVAAASIIARAKYLHWIQSTSNKLGLTIPKGASLKVITAAEKLKTNGHDLSLYVKTHFKTYLQLSK